MLNKGNYACYECGSGIEIDARVQRRDECTSCGADLHICKNCRFWDPAYHNECRETGAFYIRDREKANFCTLFEFKSTIESETSKANDARAKLEALFKGLN